jgi:hypothetical protein
MGLLLSVMLCLHPLLLMALLLMPLLLLLLASHGL